jgi:hypothetical protein
MSFLPSQETFDHTVEAVTRIPSEFVANPYEIAAYTGIEMLGMYLEDQFPLASTSMQARLVLGFGQAIRTKACNVVNNYLHH